MANIFGFGDCLTFHTNPFRNIPSDVPYIPDILLKTHQEKYQTMAKRDPFADKRKTSNGCRPAQANTQIRRKNARGYKRKAKVTKDLAAKESELAATEKKVARQKELLEMMESAPTIAQQRKLMYCMFKEAGFNPIQSLIEDLDNPDLSAKEKLGIKKELAAYYASKPKSVDVQADVKGNLTIGVVDFSKVSQKDLAVPVEAEVVEDSGYDEFLSPEELEQRDRQKRIDEKGQEGSVE